MKTTFEVTIYEPEGRPDPMVTSEHVRWAVLSKVAERAGYGEVTEERFRLIAPSLAPSEGKFGVEVEYQGRS